VAAFGGGCFCYLVQRVDRAGAWCCLEPSGTGGLAMSGGLRATLTMPSAPGRGSRGGPMSRSLSCVFESVFLCQCWHPDVARTPQIKLEGARWIPSQQWPGVQGPADAAGAGRGPLVAPDLT
jgi:hypothetical protein